MKLTNKDIRLLQCLRTNSRLTLTQISKKTKIPISTLFDRLKIQEKNMNLKHTTLIDFSKLGYHTKVHLLLKTQLDQRDRLKKYLQFHEHVNAVYRVANKYDFFVQGLFKHINEANTFIEELETRFPPLECDSHFVVEDLKREGFFLAE